MESRAILLLFQLVAAVSLVHADPVGSKCTNLADTTCACSHPDGVIDLTPLSKSDGTAMFQNVPNTAGSDLFEYNPCNKFSSADIACQNVFCCQQTQPGSYFEIANADEQIYIDEGGEGNYVYYTGPADNGLKREVFVTLVCDQKMPENNYTITSSGDSQVTLLYRFTLTTCHACPGGCSSGGGGAIVGYIGIIVIFLALIALIVYFIVGAVIMKVHYKKEGSEIIPNKGFWFALPILIKDGFKLTFSPCIKLVKKDKYEPM